VTESTEVPPKAGRIVIDWVVGHDPDDFDTYGWRLQCDPKLPDEVVVALLAEVLKVY
jgi:hypothetical protein